MNIRLQTATPEFYSDLGDVLRIFLGDVTVTDLSGQDAEPGEDLYVHTFETIDNVWIDRWENAGRCGGCCRVPLRRWRRGWRFHGDFRIMWSILHPIRGYMAL